jgi:membrane protein insertase Oxa1/YidC/SpoIIIJ
MSGTAPDLNMETILAQLARAREETQKFTAEQHKLMAEQQKFAAEQQKLNFEALKLERERGILPWQVAATMLGAGAALFAAGAGFVKLIGG